MHRDDKRELRTDFRLFVLERPGRFADDVARELGIEPHAHEDRSFEDGEHKLRPLVSVRDCDVFILHSLYGEPDESVHDKLLKLLLFIGALKDASARRITAVIPYLAYARKDRKSKSRDPVATRYVAQLFEAVGTDCVVTLDVHNVAAFQNAFRCRTEHLEANPLFVRHFAAVVGDLPVTVVAPDAGGIKRAEAFRQRLEATLHRRVGMAFAEKHRSQGVISGQAFLGDVADHMAIIVDDLISSGTTLARTAETCRQRGATRVDAVATHGAFATGANTILAEASIDHVIVTDTVAPRHVTAQPLATKILTLATGALLAESIRRLHGGGSLVELMQQ